MKLSSANSKFYSFTVMLAFFGVLALPIGCSHMDQMGSNQERSTEDEVQGEKVDWTLAEAETEEDETDWTLA